MNSLIKSAISSFCELQQVEFLPFQWNTLIFLYSEVCIYFCVRSEAPQHLCLRWLKFIFICCCVPFSQTVQHKRNKLSLSFRGHTGKSEITFALKSFDFLQLSVTWKIDSWKIRVKIMFDKIIKDYSVFFLSVFILYI